MSEGASDTAPLEAELPTPPQEIEEEDVCRVCRVEGDEEMPLIYPCKCSGSVRYVHPDCLKSWLAASQKKHCEICGYKYNFTKVYPDYIPHTIPVTVYLRQAFRWTIEIGRRIFRLWFATNAWLILLPALNMSSLRTLLWATDFLSPSPPSHNGQVGNSTMTNTTITSSLRWDNETRLAFTYMYHHPVSAAGLLARDSWTRWNAGEQDTAIGYIFRGQLLTVTLAAVILGLVLIREWMGQHILTDTPKPSPPGPINPDDHVVINGLQYDNRMDAYLAYCYKLSLPPAKNTLMRGEFRRSKRLMYQSILNGQKESIRLLEIKCYIFGNPTISKDFPDRQIIRDIADADPLMTLGLLRRGSERDKLLSGHIDLLLTKFMDAKSLSTRGRLANAGKLDEWGNGSSDEEKDLWDSEKYPSTDSAAYRAVLRNLEHPSYPKSEGLAQDSPFSGPSGESSTPPRPVNAGDQGFGEHVSYTAPELLDDEVDDSTPGAGRSFTIEIVNAESRRKDKLARMRRQQKRESEAKAAGIPFEMDGEQVEGDEDDAEGWVTDDSNTAENGEAGPSRPNPALNVQTVDGPDGPASVWNKDIPFDDPRHRRLVEALGIRRAGPTDLPANPVGTDPETQRQAARAALADLLNGMQLRTEARPTTPDADETDHDNDGDDGSRYPALNDATQTADTMHAPNPLDGLLDGDHLFPAREDDDADDDADDDEQEGEEEQEDPRDAPGHDHDHDMEDMEGLDHDDWNGVLEVIGLIGPIQNLAQNVCFGFIIIGASMSILAGIPIWIGRLFLSIDYWHSAKYSSLLVIKGTRLIFDPLVRVVYDILSQVVIGPVFSSIMALEKIVADSAGLGDTSLPKVNWIPSIPPTVRETATTKAGDLFAQIGKTTQTYASTVYEAHGTWSTKVLSSGSLSNRLWTMAYGYGVILAVVVFIALNPAGFRGDKGGSFGGQFQDTAQYAKLAFFMFAELAIFPATIGMVIQVCIVPLTPNWSMDTLLEYFQQVPFGALFVTWIIGTSFMFVFAGVLQTLRKMCRKGVLFFIRDPSEQSYNPVKDILDRPTTSQMRKLGISAFMYTIVAIFLFGAVSWGLTLPPINRLELVPLRTTAFKSISTVPFDLLFFSIAIGPTLNSLRIASRGRRWMRLWWDYTADTFNLTNMLTDKNRSRLTESTAVLRAWRVVDFIAQLVLGRYDNNETWARVPAADSVVLLKPEIRKGRGVFVRLDQFGQPITPEGKLLLLQQNQAAVAANRNPKVDYKIVWLPKYWRTRVHAVVYSALVVCGSLVAMAVFAPLVVGRLLLDRAFGEPVHDGYNWLTGVYVLWATYYLAKTARQSIVLSQLAARLRRSTGSTRAKRALVGAMERTYVLTILYFIIPVAVGLLWEMYIAMPFRYGFKSYIPVLHFWETWAMGLVLVLTYVAITHDSDHDPRHPGRPMVLGQQMRECYRTSFTTDAITVYSSTYAFIGFVLFIDVAPSLAGSIPAYLYRSQTDINTFSVIYRFAHPVLLAILVSLACRKALMRRWAGLRQILIDAEYVLEERVENYEPGHKKKVTFGEGSKQFDGSDNDDDESDDDNDGAVWEDLEEERVR